MKSYLLTIKILMAMMIASWAGLAMYIYIAKIDGRVNPVIVDFEITDIRLNINDDDASMVSGRYVKVRDCEFDSIEWFFKTSDSGKDRVSVVARNIEYFQLPPREIGPHEFASLFVELTENEILKFSEAYVYHNCYDLPPIFPKWLTETKVYDSFTVVK